MSQPRKLSNRQLGKNILLSILVQIISMLVSFVLNLIVPKFIDEYQYAYWQSFVLYLGYVGILHFGLLDGIVLRYSQYDYDELDKERLRSQFKILLYSVSAMAILGCLFALIFCDGIVRSTIIFVSIGIIFRNVFTYSSYSFQITNRISKYAILVIVQRLGYGVMAVVLLLLRVNRFEWYCIADLFGDFLAVIVAFFFNKGLHFGKSLPAKEAFAEWKKNTASGFILLLANWTSLLLLGSAKMIIQWHWDELVFGKISFSFSLSGIFLTFISAISVVLFPSLKRMEQDKLPELYRKIRGGMSPLLFVMMIFYFPGCWILEMFIPAYSDSLVYLGTLLPIVVFSAIVSLLTNNYLKAYRKEGAMLVVNLISIVISVALFAVGAYVLNSLMFVLVAIVLATMINSILSEVVVMKTIRVRFVKDFILEALLTIAFIVFANVFDRWVAMGLYAAVVFVYLGYQFRIPTVLTNKLKQHRGTQE